MHKSQFMSQIRITLPVTVSDLYSSGTIGFPRFRSSKRDDTATEIEKAAAAFLAVLRVKGKPPRTFDPWKLRDAFLAWPLEDWQDFCEMVDLGVPQISKNEFADWQRLFRKALILPAREWKTLAGEFAQQKVKRLLERLPIDFEWEAETPIARINCTSAFKTIIATIQVDALQGAQFRVCARHDCNNPPFRVEARHKIFCCSDCAHLVAVRKSRERAAEAKNKAVKKTPERKRRG